MSDLEQAIALSLESWNQGHSLNEEILRIALEESLTLNYSKNDCLERAFSKLYKIWKERNFNGDVRDIIQQHALSLYGQIDLTQYSLSNGQQLPKSALDLIFDYYSMKVPYLRSQNNKIQIEEYIGRQDGISKIGYGVLHTVNSEFGVQGEQRYAGHYEAVMFFTQEDGSILILETL